MCYPFNCDNHCDESADVQVSVKCPKHKIVHDRRAPCPGCLRDRILQAQARQLDVSLVPSQEER